MKRFLLPLILALILCVPRIQAGIIITSPAQHTVIQRDQDNQGRLQISGIYTIPYQTLEARLISLPEQSEGTGTWVPLDVPGQQGIFLGTLVAPGGWYRLEVRGIMPDNEVDTVSVQPVGIGEVFLVAGHSNAMGLPDLGAKSPSERVISFNALNKYLNGDNITVAPDIPMPIPHFEPLKAENRIFPSGESAWYWGELGAKLVARLGVPVLFMNAGWAAANSINWRESAEGRNTLNIYVGKDWPNRQPYSNLINTLRSYHSWLGLRGILWFHGENDAAHLKISQADYYNNLHRMFQIARHDFGYPLNWVVALCSVSFIIDPYLPVLDAQIQLAAELGNWRGPYTDTIQVPRPDHGHFENVPGGTQGLTQMAQAWNRALSDTFFAQRPAYTPTAFINTGLVPREAAPGQSFLLPYEVIGQIPDTAKIAVQLLDSQGNFLATVGSGLQSPVRVTLPTPLPVGGYRLRVVAQNPVLVGTASEVLTLKNGLGTPQVIRSLEARVLDHSIEIHALAAPTPGTLSITLERSDDRAAFQAVGTVPAFADDRSSQLYSFIDTNPSPQTAYYRIRLDYPDGTSQYSPLVAVFRGETPSVLTAFPNPASSGAPIYLRTDFEEPFRYQLFNAQGQLIPAEIGDSGIRGLSVLQTPNLLPPGVYLLKTERNGTRQTQRIMVR
ncbi:sialate O-acetylesterase [Salmonirosea aquatica]